MTKKTWSRWGAVAVLAAGLSQPALAAMGNTATNYGLLPADVGSAQGMSMFNTQASALYYNPAFLTRDPRGELSIGLLHGEQRLKAISNGNPSGGAPVVVRDGDVLNDTPSQQQVIGMKKDLGDLTKFDFPIYFAFMAGVEKLGEEMLAFKSQTSLEGQYFSYGRQPMFLSLGGAMELNNGISTGAAAEVTLSSQAQLVASADLAGNTQYEKLNVAAKPVIRPILSLNLQWNKIICGHKGCGIFDKFETAFTFRGHSESSTSVQSRITIPGTVVDPGITLLIDTLDSYQPDIYSAGLLYHVNDNLRFALTVEQQHWRDLEAKLKRDTIKDQANVGLKNIVVPRLGFDWKVNKHFSLTGGVAYQETPLEKMQTPDVNYLDSDKIIVGLGSSLTIPNPPILAYPVQLSFGYQFQKLMKRDFELTTTRPGVQNPYESVTAEGMSNVFSGAVTIKF
ncbi:MAG: aromatic hydrocarbon degradation protein [Alcanivorax sp.]|nr:aromatic hydrocarbon degradation protein [Alcanivorax sp.]